MTIKSKFEFFCVVGLFVTWMLYLFINNAETLWLTSAFAGLNLGRYLGEIV